MSKISYTWEWPAYGSKRRVQKMSTFLFAFVSFYSRIVIKKLSSPQLKVFRKIERSNKCYSKTYYGHFWKRRGEGVAGDLHVVNWNRAHFLNFLLFQRINNYFKFSKKNHLAKPITIFGKAEKKNSGNLFFSILNIFRKKGHFWGGGASCR